MRTLRTWLAASVAVLTMIVPALVSKSVADPGNNLMHVAAVYPKDDIVVKGTVKQVEAEGSFWGIVGDDGKHYEVINLPDMFKKQGLRVKIFGKVSPDQVSYHMWGIRVDAITVEKIVE